MITQRELFYRHLAQTSDSPLCLEIVKAEGIYLFDNNGKKYLDLISGISVSNIGHRHPKVLTAIHKQLEKYMYLMVYGEYIQSPQIQLAKLLCHYLPPSLDKVYLVNSGSEAIEGAMKLAKRYTGKSQFISFKNAYHGSTQGALSIMGNEEFKNAFRPLIPGVKIIEFNNYQQLEEINPTIAAVVIEMIQGEAGVIVPEKEYIRELKQRCKEAGTLLIVDEIQTGFGRTGSLFAFEQFDITPDIIVLAKGMGGGMPIGAFVAKQEIMNTLTMDPPLGHITTFGGHPVSCAAAIASIEVLLEEKLIESVKVKENLFISLLQHPKIKQVRSSGLLIALEFESQELCKKVVDNCLNQGLITDWFLFCPRALRIAPPLIISEEEIKLSVAVILKSIEKALNN